MAYDIEVEGIYYDFYGSDASVVGVNSTYFSGTNSTDVIIPERISNNDNIYPVTSINSEAFKNVSWMTSITIPNTITSMGEKAFYGCSNLTNVNISDIAAWCKIDFHFLVNDYRNYSIDGDSGSDFYYGGNPLREAHHLYMNGEEIVNLVIPETVDSISFGAFYDCRGIRSVDTGSGVTYIAAEAFHIESYYEYGEYIKGNLEELTIGENVKQMGSSYGYWYGKWEQWLYAGALPSHVERVTYKATSCEDVGFYSYWGGGQLTSFDEIIIDEGVKVLPVVFSYNNNDLKIIYYNAKNCICNYSPYPFANCSNLNQIVIGSNVESIGDYMFYNQGYQLNLDTIICYATVPPVITINCFSETIYDRAILYVPENSLQAYRNADGWDEFWRIVAMKESITPGDINGDGGVTIADVTVLIDLLLSGTGDSNPVADIDGDGSLTIADATSLIDYLLKGSW